MKFLFLMLFSCTDVGKEGPAPSETGETGETGEPIITEPVTRTNLVFVSDVFAFEITFDLGEMESAQFGGAGAASLDAKWFAATAYNYGDTATGGDGAVVAWRMSDVVLGTTAKVEDLPLMVYGDENYVGGDGDNLVLENAGDYWLYTSAPYGGASREGETYTIKLSEYDDSEGVSLLASDASTARIMGAAEDMMLGFRTAGPESTICLGGANPDGASVYCVERTYLQDGRYSDTTPITDVDAAPLYLVSAYEEYGIAPDAPGSQALYVAPFMYVGDPGGTAERGGSPCSSPRDGSDEICDENGYVMAFDGASGSPLFAVPGLTNSAAFGYRLFPIPTSGGEYLLAMTNADRGVVLDGRESALANELIGPAYTREGGEADGWAWDVSALLLSEPVTFTTAEGEEVTVEAGDTLIAVGSAYALVGEGRVGAVFLYRWSDWVRETNLGNSVPAPILAVYGESPSSRFGSWVELREDDGGVVWMTIGARNQDKVYQFPVAEALAAAVGGDWEITLAD